MTKVSRETRLTVSLESAVKLLADRPADVLGGALTTFVADLHGVEVGHEVRVVVGDLVVVDAPLEIAVLPFHVEADPGKGWFPVLDAELELISTAECGISVAVEGEYHPPGGLLGAVADRAGMHRLADQAIDNFFSALTARLRSSGAALDALSGVPG